VAGRPDGVRAPGPVARPAHGSRPQEVRAREATQPPGAVRVPGGGVLRAPGQSAGLGVIPGRARPQLLSPRKR